MFVEMVVALGRLGEAIVVVVAVYAWAFEEVWSVEVG